MKSARKGGSGRSKTQDVVGDAHVMRRGKARGALRRGAARCGPARPGEQVVLGLLGLLASAPARRGPGAHRRLA
jgi:hypothetical protein